MKDIRIASPSFIYILKDCILRWCKIPLRGVQTKKDVYIHVLTKYTPLGPFSNPKAEKGGWLHASRSDVNPALLVNEILDVSLQKSEGLASAHIQRSHTQQMHNHPQPTSSFSTREPLVCQLTF